MSFFHSLLYSNKGGQGGTFYVRPAGETYGTGDGTSYENAWSGNAGINWDAIPSNSKLYVAGAWSESLVVASNSRITIESLIADPFTLDGGGVLTIGVLVNSRNNVTLTDLSVTNVTISCFHFTNCTGIVTNNCVASFSGNQGFQHIGATTAIHNNPTCTSNVDDGISVHDSGIITVNGGTFDSNDQQINIISTAQCTINGSPVFTGTSTVDLYSTDADSNNSVVIIMNGGTVRNINANGGGRIVLNNVIVTGTTVLSQSAGDGSIEGNDSIFIGSLTVGAGGIATLTNCYIQLWGTQGGTTILRKCHVVDDLATNATLIAEHTFFDAVGTTNEIVDIVSGGLGQFKYCIFKNPAATQFCVAFRTGASASSYVNNCTFVGSANVGRGLFTQIDLTTSNNIAYDLEIGYFRSAGTSVLNNWCFNDCSTPKSGTVTSNNEVTGDPLFANAGADDYSLLEGSSCIGTGIDLGSDFIEGIESAIWGDDTTAPEVTTANQGVNWNIGAYV